MTFPSFRRTLTSAGILAVFATTCLRGQNSGSLLEEYHFEGIPNWMPNWGAGLSDSYKPATAWKTPFKVSLDQDNPHSGENALRFELLEPSNEKERIVHSPVIEVWPSDDRRRVLIRFFMRSSDLGEAEAAIRILERDEKGASLGLLEGQKELIPLSDSSDWVELEGEGVLNRHTTSIMFMLVIYKSEPPLSIWIDDISLELEILPTIH